ncbi:MAG: hypothetical protein Q9162_000592 [Coniocarpon cinnabarinum]
MDRDNLPLAIAFASGVFAALGLTRFQSRAKRSYSDEEQVNTLNLNISGPINVKHIAHGAEGLQALTLNQQPPPIPADAQLLAKHATHIPLKSAPSLSRNLKPSQARSGLETAIGNTPLIPLRALSEATGCTILGKAEYLNGAGNSPKDRVALSIIEAAEASGDLRPYSGDVIYEGTVGSTGISLASIARSRGYQARIVMPDDQAHEKSDLLLKLGATVERVTPAPITSPQNYINMARRKAQEHTNNMPPRRGFFADQFENEANWRAHFTGTGPEIDAQTDGRIDAFVAGAGTGGTITGVAKYFKEVKGMKGMKVVLADPQGSGLFNKVKYGVMFSETEKEGTRRRQQVDSIVEGIGCNRIVGNFDIGTENIDDAIRVSDEQALMMARFLVEKEGLFLGSSSAVNCKFAEPLI